MASGNSRKKSRRSFVLTTSLRRIGKWIRLRFAPKWVREYEKFRHK